MFILPCQKYNLRKLSLIHSFIGVPHYFVTGGLPICTVFNLEYSWIFMNICLISNHSFWATKIYLLCISTKVMVFRYVKICVEMYRYPRTHPVAKHQTDHEPSLESKYRILTLKHRLFRHFPWIITDSLPVNHNQKSLR